MTLSGLLHLESDELQKNIVSTYFSLRLGIVVLSFGLPPILYFGGIWSGQIDHLAHSMSAYYGESEGAMRDWFVGILWGVGWFLYAYKGFSALENYLLNIAGICAVLTAMIPCNCWVGAAEARQVLHYVVAVLFFISMAAVCFFCAKDTIRLLPDDATRNSFKRQYHVIGGILAISPLAAIGVSYILHQFESRTFFVEAFGVWTFAYYWFTKSREFRITAAEQLAAQGKVKNQKGVGLVKVS
jgi:hypothetical protein